MTFVSRYDDPIALWASSRVTALLEDHEDPPRYGTGEWQQLAENDPRKAAAIITAAELWRRYGDGDDLVAWIRDASRSRESLANRRTIAELDELARPKPPHQLRATSGWPPVAVPGQPGWYRHLVDGEQVDLLRGELAA